MIRTVENPRQMDALLKELRELPWPFTAIIGKDKRRSNAMNRTIHKWFAEVAKHYGDRSEAEVKAECNLIYGVPIKRRDDEEWASAFGYLFDSLNRPSKIKAIRVLDVPVTRDMTVRQLGEYMDQMSRDYRSEGVYLTDPELQRYREEAA